MNIQITTSSRLSQCTKEERIDLLIKDLSHNSLESVTKILDESALAFMQKKFQQTDNQTESVVYFLDYLISFLIQQLQTLLNQDKSQLSSSMREGMMQKYDSLQEAMQKSQAQVRKHIRIEQQFKIYLDGLEEKVQQMQKKITEEQNKNASLLKSMSQIQKEKKLLQEKIDKVQLQKIKNPTNANEMFANSRVYKDAFVSWKYTGSKSKKVIEKTNDQIIKLTNKKSLSKKIDFPTKPNEINLTNNVIKKLNNQKTANALTRQLHQQDSIKQLVQTEQMRHSKIYKGRICPIFNHKTQLSHESQNRLYRSNSVFH